MTGYFRRHRKVLLITFAVFLIFNCGFLSWISCYSLQYNKPCGHDLSEEPILEFPEGFFWGAATAAYQVEGGNKYSNWWRFEQEEGNIKNNDSAEVAVDHYNRYEEDFDLINQLNLNSYRFSIEWSRIEPEKGKFDDQELEHYRQVLQALHDRNIEPMVTLVHHSVPIWFEDEGGWETIDSADHFSRYAGYVAEKLGDGVKFWITINEPMAQISCAYVMAKWPPAKQEFTKIPALFFNMINAHKKAYEVIHENDSDAQVGIAKHSAYVMPSHSNNLIENNMAFLSDYFWAHYIIENIEGCSDFIGVHYYYRQTVNFESMRGAFTAKDLQGFEDESLEKDYYPRGLFEVLCRFRKYNKPVYITEIGVPDYHEIDRDKFIQEHLKEVYYAIQEGVDVRGVYYWALFDSFEWSEGYDPKFGLIAVDLATQARTIKEESWGYAEAAKCNCVQN